MPLRLRSACAALVLLGGCSWSEGFPGESGELAWDLDSAVLPLDARVELGAWLRSVGPQPATAQLTVSSGSADVRVVGWTPDAVSELLPGDDVRVRIQLQTLDVPGDVPLELSAGADGLVAHVHLSADFDEDGFDHVLAGGADCDDGDPNLSPAALEVWYDGIDQNCDGNDDDADFDGVSIDDDCDDQDPDRSPAEIEIWYDGVDQDCDGNDSDADGDGYFGEAAGGVDCDDEDPLTHPDAADPDDGQDQDCDGIADSDSLVLGAVLLTELMLSPDVDGAGHWLELWNPGALARPVAGMRLATDTNDVLIPADMPALPPGAGMVLCADGDAAAAAGLSCDGELEPWPTAWEGGDSLRLLAGTVAIDGMRWTAAWPVFSARALQLDGALLDDPNAATLNDQPGAWCAASDPWGAGPERGSPGVANPDCP